MHKMDRKYRSYVKQSVWWYIGVRDYIHVMDLATGHVAALKKLHQEHQRIKIYNLGTGNGVSVLQLLHTFETTTKTKVDFKICNRRDGDIVSMYANASLAESELGWKAKFTLPQMCKFHLQNDFYNKKINLAIFFEVQILIKQVKTFGGGKQ